MWGSSQVAGKNVKKTPPSFSWCCTWLLSAPCSASPQVTTEPSSNRAATQGGLHKPHSTQLILDATAVPATPSISPSHHSSSIQNGGEGTIGARNVAHPVQLIAHLTAIGHPPSHHRTGLRHHSCKAAMARINLPDIVQLILHCSAITTRPTPSQDLSIPANSEGLLDQIRWMSCRSSWTCLTCSWSATSRQAIPPQVTIPPPYQAAKAALVAAKQGLWMVASKVSPSSIPSSSRVCEICWCQPRTIPNNYIRFFETTRPLLPCTPTLAAEIPISWPASHHL